MAVALTACHKDNLDYLDNPTNNDEQQEADGSLVSVRMGVKIPDPIEVTTRAVDPDGNGIQNMTLFCFDGEGLLISTATATLEPDPNDKYNETGGILDADIPNTTRVIHLLANQNMAQFKEDEFRNLSEDQVIANLEGSSGMMIYWARVEIPANVVGSDGILQWITVMTNPNNIIYGGYHGENNPIIMLRNQAKVMVDASPTEEAGANKVWEWEGTHFVVDGFTVVNTQAFGTVAPYHTVYGYPTYTCKKSEGSTNNLPTYTENNVTLPAWEFTPAFGLTSGTTTNWRDTDYINTPRKSDKFSNISDIDTAPQTYVFETENSSADPVSVIIKGHNVVNGVAEATKYYRVTLTDSEGEQVLVRRNHCYTINIAGNLLYGVNTFAEALDTPATNNVWLSISDEIKSVQNSDFRLSVEKTSVVLDENQVATLNPKSLTLNFSVEKLGSQAINQNDLQISWVDGNQDVSNISTFVVNQNVTFTQNGNLANGTITLSLLDFNGEANKDKSMLEGTILVKYGHLQRKIKVIIVRQQKFTPTWVTSQVYTSTGSTSSNATLVFTIPQDCPAELFPMKVLISTNELDVRSETGQVLPIIRKGEEGYGEIRDDDAGYKYVYEVTGPGEQFVYMKSILSQTSGASTPITIEAEHFESVTKQVVYADHQRAITVTNVTSSETPTGRPEDKIYYVYLPQKKNAPWAINLEMMNTDTNQPQSVNQGDEFLLYSQNLDAYADSEFSTAKELLPDDSWLSQSTYFPCQFRAYSQETWSSGGRVFAFMPRFTYYDTYKLTTSNGAPMRSHFSIYMKTNKAKNAEIIRISSNQLEAKAAFQATIPNNPTTQPETDTNTIIYSNNDNDNWTYSQKGTVSTYRSMIFELRNYPAFRFAAQVNGQPTITSGTVVLTNDEESTTPVQIEYVPGTEVKVQFDVTSFINDGVEVDPFGSEFDIYIQTPGLELKEGQANVSAVDNSPGLYKYTVASTRAEALGGITALQSSKEGERKEIIFKTKDIVTEGDIVIYTNPEDISYKTKTFNVTNAPINGTITYGENDAQVPKDTFVSFSRELDGSRIGSIVVTSDGNYQLRLRKEYEFTWSQDDPVKLHARINNGTESKYYVATFANLEALYNAPNIILVEETEGN